MNYEPGDIFCCFGADFFSRRISRGTFRPWAPKHLRLGPSHVAIACEHQEKILWIESTMLAPRPCLIRGEMVRGCQAHLPHDRIQDYVTAGGKVELYRLCKIDRLDSRERYRLTTILIKHHVQAGVNYDLLDALFSGTITGRFLSRFFSTHNRAFCSELIAKVLMRVGRMNRANANPYNPGRLMRTLVRQGTYCRVAEFDDALAAGKQILQGDFG